MKLVKTIKARDGREHLVYETTAELRNASTSIMIDEEFQTFSL